MACYQTGFSVSSSGHDEVVDITEKVREALRESGIQTGTCTVFTPHATAAVAINENADPNIGGDFLKALKSLVPDHSGWLHDRVDNNAASHIKACLVGPSESIPVSEGELVLGTWQDIFLCEFDGPRRGRRVLVSIVGD